MCSYSPATGWSLEEITWRTPNPERESRARHGWPPGPAPLFSARHRTRPASSPVALLGQQWLGPAVPCMFAGETETGLVGVELSTPAIGRWMGAATCGLACSCPGAVRAKYSLQWLKVRNRS